MATAASSPGRSDSDTQKLRQWLESAVGGAICAELATLPNFTYPGDIFPSSYFYTNDLGKPEIVLSGRGEVATSRVPGIAQAPDPQLLKRWTAEHAAFRPASTR